MKFFLADRNWIGDWCGGWTEALGGLRANCGRRKRRVSPRLSDEDCQVPGVHVAANQGVGIGRFESMFVRGGPCAEDT